MAHTTIVGNLGKDPELKQSQNGGKSYAKFSVSWSERQKDATGQYFDGPTVWIQCTAFGRMAENLANSLSKGDRVIISGNMRLEEWQSNQGVSQVMTMLVDSIGPDLTFATAQVMRNERVGGGSNTFCNGGAFSGQQNQGGGQQNDPWSSAPAGSSMGNAEPPF
ncbi:single-stranded DNA-binding protein [Corynebacterium diphtheriae]|nr:single-stranded DNA-binding protein [Corynebacterium diphtheriae]